MTPTPLRSAFLLQWGIRAALGAWPLAVSGFQSGGGAASVGRVASATSPQRPRPAQKRVLPRGRSPPWWWRCCPSPPRHVPPQALGRTLVTPSPRLPVGCRRARRCPVSCPGQRAQRALLCRTRGHAPLSRVPRRKEPACGRPIPLSRALARLLLGCWGPERIWAPGGHSQQSARYAHGHRPLAEPAALPLVVLTAPSVCRFPGLCRGGRGAVGGSGARPLQQCWPPRRWWVPPGFLTP